MGKMRQATDISKKKLYAVVEPDGGLTLYTKEAYKAAGYPQNAFQIKPETAALLSPNMPLVKADFEEVQ